LLAVATTASTFVGTVQPALATGETVTSPGNVQLLSNTPDQDPGDFVIDGFGSNSVLLVGVSLGDTSVDTTFRLSDTSGLTAAYGYSFSNQLQAISFTGTQAAINNALESLLVSTGAIGGATTLNVVATLNQVNVYYNAMNDHFYKYVSSQAIPFNTARANAATQTFLGSTGYLVNILSEEENDFIKINVNAANIWLGATDDSVEGSWTWTGGPEAGINFWQGNSSGASPTGTSWYSHWAPGEPNDNGGGEDAAVTNWRGTLGLWNDVPMNSQQVNGYLIEFNAGIAGYGSNYASGQIVASIGYPPLNVNVQAGDEEVAVTWDAPTGATATSYTVTASPDGAQCTVTGSSPTGNTCTVTGLNPGTEYTFTVTAFYTGGSTASVSHSATPNASSPTSTSSTTSTTSPTLSATTPTTSTTTTSPATTSNINSTSPSTPLPVTGSADRGRGAMIAFWLFVAGVGMIVAIRQRQWM
jgi:hypothetical protein